MIQRQPTSSKRWIAPLLEWFKQNKRPMPWRSLSTPYRVWVSEIMLQQTQVETVIPYFKRFMRRFPTIERLAKANLEEVLKTWEGLGYYARARNLHKTARKLARHHRALLPRDFEELHKLPGFGPYTAAAVASIAYGEPVPVVDGNVLRLFARFWGIKDDIRHPNVRRTLFRRLLPIIANRNPADFNQSIMECGALVCIPRHPHCSSCPLKKDCTAVRLNIADQLPFKSKKPPIPHYTVAAGVIWKNGKVLIARRRATQMLGGLWEFPGGKQKAHEPLTKTVEREIREETGLRIKALTPYCTVKHSYSHFKITMTAFECRIISGKAKPRAADKLKWIGPREFNRYPFPGANRKVIQAILKSRFPACAIR